MGFDGKVSSLEKETAGKVYDKFTESIGAFRASLGFEKRGYNGSRLEKPLIITVKNSRSGLRRETVDALYDLIFDIFRSDGRPALFKTEEYISYLNGRESDENTKAAYADMVADELQGKLKEILKNYLV